MSGSKRKQDRKNRKLTRILGFTAVGLAIAVLIYVLRLAGRI